MNDRKKHSLSRFVSTLLVVGLVQGAWRDNTLAAQDLGTSEQDLQRYREDLVGDADARGQALREYARLSSEADAVVRQRVAAIRTDLRDMVRAASAAQALREDPNAVQDAQVLSDGDVASTKLSGLADAITAFRVAAGGALANDIVDVVDGVSVALAEKPARADAAEIILLARALERIGSPQAIAALGDLLASHKGLFRWELTRLIALRKERFIPFLVAWQDHPQAWVSSKCKDALEAMKVTSAGRAFALAPNPEQLVQTLAVYQHARSFDAMEAVASLMNHPAIRVRTNARKFMRWYGRNGIWQLRRLYVNQRGEDPPKSWGWKKVYAEVLAQMRDDAAFRIPDGAIAIEPEDEAEQERPSVSEAASAGSDAEQEQVAPTVSLSAAQGPPQPTPKRTGPNLWALGLAAVLVLGGGYASLRPRLRSGRAKAPAPTEGPKAQG